MLHRSRTREAGIGDRLSSTIGYERRFNAFLQFKDVKRFTDYALSWVPPEPAYYPRMKKLNAKGSKVLGNLPAVCALPPKKFQKAIGHNRNVLVDTRMMLSFGGGHIKGALNRRSGLGKHVCRHGDSEHNEEGWITMNKLEVKGDWNIAKGKLKQKWASLTDDDLQFAEGKHEELLGRIQKRTGETRAAVGKMVKEACSSCGCGCS